MAWNQRDSEAEIEHLRKRIDVIKRNRNELFDENTNLQAEIERLKEELKKERIWHGETKAALQKWERMTAKEIGEMIAGM